MDDRKYGYAYTGGPFDPRARGEYPQPYSQQPRPNYPHSLGQQGFTPPNHSNQQASEFSLEDAQILTGEGFKPLNKQERDEAARIAAQAGFSFIGYQVVRREFFSHKFDPALTIRNNGITFNNACISKLEEVVYVQVLINPDSGKLVIRPCNEGARDAVRWCVAKEDKRKSRQISCSLFTAKLYDMMGWETLYRYKMQGTRINYQGEQLYIFDLTSTEVFIPATTEGTGDEKPKKKMVTRFQTDWRDSFGIPVEDHAQSMKVNLDEGYELIDVTQNPSNEQISMEITDQETGEVTKV